MGCVASKQETVMENMEANNRSIPPADDDDEVKRRTTLNAGGRKKMGNVFATPLSVLGVREGHKIPIHEKSAEETEFLKKAVSSTFIFEHLTRREINTLVDAFEQSTINGKGTNVITQGDAGDFFYIIYNGVVEFVVNDKAVGKAEAGSSFGELALMYTSPRAATVKTVTDETILYRVDQATFRYILQAQTKEAASEKIQLLKMVSFLKDLDSIQINKLSSVMTPKKFATGEYLMRKGDAADFFYILSEGSVTAKNVGAGEAHFEDLKIDKRGDYFGERALVTGEPRAADIVADTDVTAFAIDKDTFETVLGKLDKLILRAQDKRKLSTIKVIADSKFSDATLTVLVGSLDDKKVMTGQSFLRKGVSTSPPCLYLVREGSVSIEHSKDKKTTISMGGYFGDDMLLADSSKDPKVYSAGSPPKCIPKYSVTAVGDCTLGVLSLDECRKYFDTRLIGTPAAGKTALSMNDALFQNQLTGDIKLSDLKRHTILGQGTFGQVWLVSYRYKDKKGHRQEIPYALKVQSKYELSRDGQAQAVTCEKNTMSQLKHPFLLPLIKTYKDDSFVYMLIGLVQGGELFNYIHRYNEDGVKESSARFYTGGIAEGIAYMHQRGFVYRDLKPENILIDKEGYPVIIDFGFAKKLSDKTYTLCGTPLYISPEIILNRGHDFSADHWSIGILTYEMLFGDTPFYIDGMQQMDLFKNVVKGKFEIPMKNKCGELVSTNVASMIRGFLIKDPAKRLGNLSGGETDVLEHEWFTTPIPHATSSGPLDFKLLRRKEIPAPVLPKVRNVLDASNFEDWSHLDDKTTKRYPQLAPEYEKVFDNF